MIQRNGVHTCSSFGIFFLFFLPFPSQDSLKQTPSPSLNHQKKKKEKENNSKI